MQYNENARLDTGEVRDTRASGGRGPQMALGGGGLGVIAVVILALLSLGGHGNEAQQLQTVLGQLGNGGGPATANNSEIEQSCKTGRDANEKLECAIVADIDSIQSYWTEQLPKMGKKYVRADTV